MGDDAQRKTVTRRSFLATCLGVAGVLLPWPALGASDHLCLLGRVVDGTGAPPLEEGAVLLRGDRILAVGPYSESVLPASTVVMDMRPFTLMPGVINAHAHLLHEPGARRTALFSGVTTLGDVGAPLQELEGYRKQVDAQGKLLARVQFAGPMFGPPNGYPGRRWGQAYGLAVSTPAEARKQAEMVLGQGASMLKIGFEPGPGQGPELPWPMLGVEEARTVVAVAHERGVPVRCHVQDLSGLPLALDAGVDSVEHTVSTSRQGVIFIGERGALEPSQVYSELLRRMVGEGVALVPTLEMRQRSTWDASGALAAVRMFHEAGGRVVLGTDAPLRGMPLTMPLREMELLSEAGLTNGDIVQAATVRAAELVGQGSDLGTIEPGRVADLIAVDGDPLTDLSCLGRVRMVFKNGILL